MALMAYGVGPGDAIFTTPFTFIAAGEVISLLGAVPIFGDVDPEASRSAKSFQSVSSVFRCTPARIKKTPVLAKPIHRSREFENGDGHSPRPNPA
jgi:hypothetical protein